jgi:hypothetical protein
MRKLITALEATPAHLPLLFAAADFILVVLVAVIALLGPPLWSSGQSSWLQIQRLGFDFLRSSGSGTGSTQPVSTTEELLDRKVTAPV